MKAVAGFLQLLALITATFGLGFGLGAFGHFVNNLFRRRAALTFEVMHRKPKLSLLTGFVVTLLGLGMIASLCREHGAQLVVLTYPEGGSRSDVTRAFAADTGTHLIDIVPRFAAALQGQRRDALFVADGHCNDRGYAIVAEAVRDWLVH